MNANEFSRIVFRGWLLLMIVNRKLNDVKMHIFWMLINNVMLSVSWLWLRWIFISNTRRMLRLGAQSICQSAGIKTRTIRVQKSQRTVKLIVFFFIIMCAAFVALTIYNLQVSLCRTPSKLVCLSWFLFLNAHHTKTLIMMIIYHE